MLLTVETSEAAVLQWDPGAEMVIPNNHGPSPTVFAWDTEEETVVPGHHTTSLPVFTWE
jgi:hypothetical protein